jgi:GNAT superfamily N-acetyltransferase
MAELGAFFGNPNIQRQGARARALAGQRDVNTLADPRTYAIVQGLLGTAPDQMGLSVLNPDYEKIRKVAEPAFALGLLGQAAPLLAPMTKGLPVGASVKSLDDIFKKYPDVTIDASVGKNDINLSRIVVPKEMRNKGIGTQVMSDLSEYADSLGKRITLTPSSDFGGTVPKLKTFYKELGFVENKGKNKDFSTREAMYREPQPVNTSANYPRQEALDTAQRNAALSIEEGGLGLPKDNTPEMRAEASGLLDAYHGSKQDITGLFKAGYDDNLAFVTQDPEFASKWIGKGKLNQRIGAEDEMKAAEDLYRQNKYKHTDNALLEKLQGEEFNAAYDKMAAAARAENEREFGTRGNATGLFDTVYPVKVQANKTFNPETDMDVMKDFFVANDIPPKLQELYAGGNYMMYETKPVVNYLKSKGYDSMRLRESTGDNYPTIAVFNPETVRSRFAAFDPFRRDAETALSKGVAPPDLLAGLLPLGLLDEEKRKEITSLLE